MPNVFVFSGDGGSPYCKTLAVAYEDATGATSLIEDGFNAPPLAEVVEYRLVTASIDRAADFRTTLNCRANRIEAPSRESDIDSPAA